MANENKFNPQVVIEILKNGFSNFDFQRTVDIYKKLFAFNADFWPQIKEESISIKDFYEKYLVVLSVLSPIGTFILTSRLGTTDVTSRVISLLIGYIALLASPYLGALVIEKIASYFGGTCSRENAFKLIAYSMLPGLAVGILFLFANMIIAFITLAVSLCGLYLFWTGIDVMVATPADKKLPFFITFIGVMIVINMFVSMLH
ncbi:MAG: YIP1 family protein [Proteobacteria bacterium]|nr:YIP1 family protein [Pseudomonadota bacterium]